MKKIDICSFTLSTLIVDNYRFCYEKINIRHFLIVVVNQCICNSEKKKTLIIVCTW